MGNTGYPQMDETLYVTVKNAAGEADHRRLIVSHDPAKDVGRRDPETGQGQLVSGQVLLEDMDTFRGYYGALGGWHQFNDIPGGNPGEFDHWHRASKQHTSG